MDKHKALYNWCNLTGLAKLKQVFVLLCSCSLIFASVAHSNPVLNSVTSGQASVSSSGNTTTIDQTSQQAIINWNSFNINANEKTQFVQPNSSSVALNRINPTQGASQIYGTLTSNGQIILINAAGIHFGAGSMVNVGGLIASTVDISDRNFLAGKYYFNKRSKYVGSIVNDGTINAANYGLVALLGNRVVNHGTIQAELGSVALGSGSKFTLDFNGDQLVNFSVDAAAKATRGRHHHNQSGILNTGTLLADGGQILVSAQAAAGVIDNVIDMRGVAEAQSVSQHNGVIVLNGGKNGRVKVSGTLNASGTATGSAGGLIKILGNNILITGKANINVSGDIGGGNINIGGDEHGAGPDPNALAAIVDVGSILNASAITRGNGGNIIVWSNDNTEVGGSIVATGGAQSGNGGFVETSGNYLAVLASAVVNLLAPEGVTGNWLLDPAEVTISNNATSGEVLPVCNGGQCTPLPGSNDSPSNINIAQLIAELSNANVIITSDNGSTGPGGDIIVQNQIMYASSNTLTLYAVQNGNININNMIVNAGSGNLILKAGGAINLDASIALKGGGSLIMTAGSGVGAINVNAALLARGIIFNGTATLNNDVTATSTQIYNAPVNVASNVNLTVEGNGAIDMVTGISGSGVTLTLTGNNGNNTFELGGPISIDNIAVDANLSGNILDVQSSSALQTWLVNSSNSGVIKGVANDSFNFNGINSINGGNSSGSNSILSAADGNTIVITGSGQGNINGVLQFANFTTVVPTASTKVDEAGSGSATNVVDVVNSTSFFNEGSNYNTSTTNNDLILGSPVQTAMENTIITTNGVNKNIKAIDEKQVNINTAKIIAQKIYARCL